MRSDFPLKIVVEVSAETAATIASPANTLLQMLNAGFDRRVSLSGLLRQVPEQPAHGSLKVIPESVVCNTQFLPQHNLDGSRIVVVATVPDTNESVAGKRGGQKVLAGGANGAAGFQNLLKQCLRLLLKPVLFFLQRLQIGQLPVDPLPILCQVTIFAGVAYSPSRRVSTSRS